MRISSRRLTPSAPSRARIIWRALAYAAEVDSSSIAKSSFIFSFRNGATSHAFWMRQHWWRAEADDDWILSDVERNGELDEHTRECSDCEGFFCSNGRQR